MAGRKLNIIKIPSRRSFDPVVWRFFSILKGRGLSIRDLSEISGVGYKTIGSWSSKKRSPTLINFRAAANALGYELVLLPQEEVDRYYGVDDKIKIVKNAK